MLNDKDDVSVEVADNVEELEKYAQVENKYPINIRVPAAVGQTAAEAYRDYLRYTPIKSAVRSGYNVIVIEANYSHFKLNFLTRKVEFIQEERAPSLYSPQVLTEKEVEEIKVNYQNVFFGDEGIFANIKLDLSDMWDPRTRYDLNLNSVTSLNEQKKENPSALAKKLADDISNGTTNSLLPEYLSIEGLGVKFELTPVLDAGQETDFFDVKAILVDGEDIKFDSFKSEEKQVLMNYLSDLSNQISQQLRNIWEPTGIGSNKERDGRKDLDKRIKQQYHDLIVVPAIQKIVDSCKYDDDKKEVGRALSVLVRSKSGMNPEIAQKVMELIIDSAK